MIENHVVDTISDPLVLMLIRRGVPDHSAELLIKILEDKFSACAVMSAVDHDERDATPDLDSYPRYAGNMSDNMNVEKCGV